MQAAWDAVTAGVSNIMALGDGMAGLLLTLPIVATVSSVVRRIFKGRK